MIIDRQAKIWITQDHSLTEVLKIPLSAPVVGGAAKNLPTLEPEKQSVLNVNHANDIECHATRCKRR